MHREQPAAQTTGNI